MSTNGVNNVGKELKLTDSQMAALKKVASHIDLCELTQDQYTLRDVARIADLAEAWVRTQLRKGKIAATKDKAGKWQVSKVELARIRSLQVQKLVGRAERKPGEKKYTNYRPTEWADRLTRKAVLNDTKLSAKQREEFINALNRYKVEWEREYQ